MTALPTPLRFLGAPGSPYTRKMRALLRYRGIPYEMIVQGSASDRDLPRVKVPLLPTFYLPDASGEIVGVTDSTPLIRRFEQAFPGRSAIPADPALGFLDLLLEDYGDEWLTKAMFHYRWAHDADVKKAGAILPLWRGVDVSDEAIAPFQKAVAERQIARLYVVGSNETTGPVIEASYERFLARLDAHLQQRPFVMGRRPGSSDFAIYGQLTQLALFDPTPMGVTLERSPRIYAWVEGIEDLSGLAVDDDGWLAGDERDLLRPLLEEMGRTYVPVMRANEQAVASGAEQVACEVEGKPWVQRPFPYQAKCLRWLREAHQALPSDARSSVDALLAGTGCEALFAG